MELRLGYRPLLYQRIEKLLCETTKITIRMSEGHCSLIYHEELKTPQQLRRLAS
jgi:hypothetical protein